jgi:hypothetical protein
MALVPKCSNNAGNFGRPQQYRSSGIAVLCGQEPFSLRRDVQLRVGTGSESQLERPAILSWIPLPIFDNLNAPITVDRTPTFAECLR